MAIFRVANSIFLIVTILLFTGCSRQPISSPAPLPATANKSAASFVNKVWRVTEPGNSADGTLYVFLSDGTLLISSPHGKPALGTWKRDGAGLLMIEESVPYKTEVLKLADDEFKVRSNNPGGAVEINMKSARE